MSLSICELVYTDFEIKVEKSTTQRIGQQEKKDQWPSSNLGPTLYRGVSATSYRSQSRPLVPNCPILWTVDFSTFISKSVPAHEYSVTHREKEAATSTTSSFQIRAHASHRWAFYIPSHRTQYQPRDMGLKRPLDSGTPVTSTKWWLGSKDLDWDWWPWLKLLDRA